MYFVCYHKLFLAFDQSSQSCIITNIAGAYLSTIIKENTYMNSRNIFIGIVVVVGIVIVLFFVFRSPATAPLEEADTEMPAPVEIFEDENDIEIVPDFEIIESEDIVLEGE